MSSTYEDYEEDMSDIYMEEVARQVYESEIINKALEPRPYI